tara:strand:+ start:2257 stop:2535 length:279 start_codon:yes stop_codon:yes gene_type:complete
MTLLNILTFNFVFDIAFLIFAIAVIWKMRNHKKKIEHMESEMENFNNDANQRLQIHKQALIEIYGNLETINERVTSVIKNPQKAKRDLNSKR